MALFKELTPGQKAMEFEKKAQADSVHLANDAWYSLEHIKKELIEVPEISNLDAFKKRILSNVNFAWKNDLTERQKSYYYQNLQVFIKTEIERDKYFDRLISLASDDIVQRFIDYTTKRHQKVI